jgi:hypothetical protein
MTRITVDTNIIPADDIVEICKKKGYECACISVSNREIEGTIIRKGNESRARDSRICSFW